MFVTQKADNGDVIRCQTNFSRPLDPPVTSEVEASNSPSYNYNATFNIEHVITKVRAKCFYMHRNRNTY